MGGNVFLNTRQIHRNDIESTLISYFDELSRLFPNKRELFNTSHFYLLGSAGKKEYSNDIDLGIDVVDLMTDLESYSLDHDSVYSAFELLQKRARTSTRDQLWQKAILKGIALHINSNSTLIQCDENKITPGNLFTCFDNVQIDWMVGPVEWLKFSYYSNAYPEESNVKGLHRTQLLLAAFYAVGLSFNHTSGVKDSKTGNILATKPYEALTILGNRIGKWITMENAMDYYKLFGVIADCEYEVYDTIIDAYLKILDLTRCDIPDNLHNTWKERKSYLGLTGKFLPETSKLKEYV